MTDLRWSATGLLFENCNCQLVCPGHISFKQKCTHERCVGIWAMHFDSGRFGDTPLAGLNAAVQWETPQLMMAGDWTTAMFVDERADARQREAIEAILSGAAGGPWKVLARFVARRRETLFIPIHFEDAGRKKRMWSDGVFEISVEAIRGKDQADVAVLSNVFNQIHTPVKVLALGHSRVERGAPIEMQGTHALYSSFSWLVNTAPAQETGA